MVKYRITSLLAIADGQALLKAVFPNYDGEQAYFDVAEIVVIFDSAQTPVNLGALIKVEVIKTPKTIV
jgi:hypothetical protein